jgi:hypothetical protein
MRKTFMVVGIATATLVFTMAGPTPEQGFSLQPAEAARPSLTVTVASHATPERTRVQKQPPEGRNHQERGVDLPALQLRAHHGQPQTPSPQGDNH